MNDVLQAKVDRLKKSSLNVTKATNKAQRDAAEKFLVQRANEMEQEQTRLAQWLHDADQYIESNMPEINGDEGNGYNQEWLENLNDYQVISRALSNAWDAFIEAREAA